MPKKILINLGDNFLSIEWVKGSARFLLSERRAAAPLREPFFIFLFEEAAMEENAIGSIVIDAAFEVHRNLGPGLLETVYETAMAHELHQRGLLVRRQTIIPVTYKNMSFDEGFRADIVVEGKVILELKSVESVIAAHRKQIQTYLSLTGCKLGYLLNFGEALMRDGIIRAVNGLAE